MMEICFFGKLRLLLLGLCSLFILNEAATVKRLCYWCGPLAEQVNRSPRAPSCDSSTEPIITGCEPEFPYCAVVATSPPYVESRLCVKLYQDECYPLFCNSTKTWKMTCPCRDDLCNGANTERENEAFSILDKLVAKTKTSRIKKRTGINAVQFIPSGTEKTQIINNISVSNNIPIQVNDENKNENHKTQIIIANVPTSNNDGDLENVLTTQEPTEEVLTTDTEIKNENSIKDDEHKMQILPNELIRDEIIEIENNLTSIEPIEDYVPTAPEVKVDNMINILRASEELPTAEALQQNTTPKANENTTPSSTEDITDMTTEEVEMTTEDNSQKNTASTLYEKCIMGLNVFVVQYYLISYFH